MQELKSDKYDRIPYSLVVPSKAKFKETYGGGLKDAVIIEGQYFRPKKTPPSKTVLIFQHPASLLHNLPMPIALAEAGIPVICSGSRYPKNDSALIMEKAITDMGSHVRYAKEVLGFEKVILAGWSGGGSLSLFYQSEAEKPTITHTPAGDECDLAAEKFIPADAVMQLACHVSRAYIMTEWIDPSILDEQDPDKRDPEFDMFGGKIKPPYDRDWLAEFRKRQIARSKRIDTFCFEMLEKLAKNPRGEQERCFVFHGTRADPALFDISIEPNDRNPPNMNSMGNPAEVNMGPSGVARYTGLRSWLSQWSYTHTRCIGPKCLERVSVPLLVVENSADDACLPSHPARIFEAGRGDKEKHVIKGATHYYHDQPHLKQQSVDTVMSWMQRKGFWNA